MRSAVGTQTVWTLNLMINKVTTGLYTVLIRVNTVAPTDIFKHYVLDINTAHEALTKEMKVTFEKAAWEAGSITPAFGYQIRFALTPVYLNT